MNKSLHCAAVAAALLTMLSAGAASGTPVAASAGNTLGAVLDRPAAQVAAPQQRVMLGLARAGTRVVAVGERGLIVWSDDDGKSWRQAAVPVSVTLTAVSFASPILGWAVGHAGVVLHTVDGGEHWTRQLDGRAVIALVTKGAAGTDQQATAAQLAADGPDKPLLDVHFFDARRGVVVGAYGLALRTDDGGATWQSLMNLIDNPKGLHIYAIGARADQVWLAGEQGLLARSADGGKSFVSVTAPYPGSYFNAAILPGGDVLVGGLKGNVYRLNAQGMNARKVDGFTPVSLSAMALLETSRVVFANQSGQLFGSSSDTLSAQPLALGARGAPLNALLQSIRGTLIGAGVRGVQPLLHTGGAQ